MKNLLIILSIIFFNSACHKSTKIYDNDFGLPNATQSGKNTFGFLLNGEPWTPKGFNGTANLGLYYDETFNNGVFNLGAYRILNNEGLRQRLNLFGDFIQEPDRILLPNNTKFGLIIKDDISGCDYNVIDSNVQILSGYFDIKKLDKVNRIFAGEFEINISKTGCPDIHITQGRFDMKY